MNIDERRSTITFEANPSDTYANQERVQWYFKFPKIPTFDMWPIPWIRTLPLPRSFRGSSAELPQISYNEMDVSFNMQFLYFLEGQLLIARIFKYKNEISREWMIWRKQLHSICFCELPQKKKAQKAFRGLPRLQSGTIFQVLWHNPAYHYVENKWRCSDGKSKVVPWKMGKGWIEIHEKTFFVIFHISCTNLISIKEAKLEPISPLRPESGANFGRTFFSSLWKKKWCC